MGLPLLPDLDLDPDLALTKTESALSGADDGELYLEHSKAQTLVFDDGRLKRDLTTKIAALAYALWLVS